METKSEIKNKIQAYLAKNDLQFETLGENNTLNKHTLCVTQSQETICTPKQAYEFLNEVFEYEVDKKMVKFDHFSLPTLEQNILGWIYSASEGYYFIKFRGNHLYLVDRRFFE